MGPLVVLITVVCGIGFWWYRFQQTKQATKEISQSLDSAAKNFKANRQASFHSLYEINRIDDPLCAAATLIFCVLCEGGPIHPKTIAKTTQLLQEVAGSNDINVAITNGKFAQSKTTRISEAIELLCGKLNAWLDQEERMQLLDILRAVAVATPNRKPHSANHIVKTRQCLNVLG